MLIFTSLNLFNNFYIFKCSIMNYLLACLLPWMFRWLLWCYNTGQANVLTDNDTCCQAWVLAFESPKFIRWKQRTPLEAILWPPHVCRGPRTWVCVRCTQRQISKHNSKNSSANKFTGTSFDAWRTISCKKELAFHKHRRRVPVSSQPCQRFASMIDKVVPQ